MLSDVAAVKKEKWGGSTTITLQSFQEINMADSLIEAETILAGRARAEIARMSKPKRRWYQYTLRTLLALMTLAAMVLAAWKTYIAPFQNQAQAMERLLVIPGMPGSAPEVRAEPALPGWLRWMPGSGSLVRVTFVKLEHTGVTDDDLSCLADLPHVERLYLAATGISDKGLQHVRGLSRLRRLSLWNTAVTDGGIEHLRGLRNLETLDIQGTAVTEAALDSLKHLPNLHEFPNDIVLSDLGLARLRAFRNARDLELPSVDARHITDRGMADLGHLGGVKSIMIVESKVSAAGLEHLRRLDKLDGLSIMYTACTPQGLLVLSTLPQVSQIHLDSVAGIHFGDLARAWGEKMERLGLSPAPIYAGNCNFSCNGKGRSLEVSLPIADAELVDLKYFPNVKSLTIGHFNSTGLAHVKNLRQLEEFALVTALDDSSLPPLAHLPRLRSLSIEHDPKFPCCLSDAGLRPLQTMPQIQVLRFSYVPLKDEQLSFLAGMTKLNALRVSDAYTVTGCFFVYLQNLPALEDISLVDCPSVVDGSLAHLERIKTLKDICLQYTAVTDRGLSHLYGLPVLAHVTFLRSNVTDAGRARLHSTLPNARNVW